MLVSKIIKSYSLRCILICLAGIIPILGYTNSIFAGAISGIVLGEKTNEPKGYVGLKVIDQDGQLVKRVISKKDGTFQISSIPEGAYKVKVETNGMVKDVQVAKAPPVTTVDFKIPEKGYYVWTGTTFLWLGVGLVGAAAVGGAVAYGVGAFDSDSSDDDVASPHD